MAKSISHPDCVHCRFMVRNPTGEYHCRQHNIKLHTPVSLFCKHIEPAFKQDDDYQQWFTTNLDINTLEINMLYTWVETLVIQQSQRQTLIDLDTIAPVTVYSRWSAGTFWETLRVARLSRRKDYQQQGYILDKAKTIK